MSGNGPSTFSTFTVAGSHADANVTAMYVGGKWDASDLKYSTPDSTAEFEFGGASYGSGEMSTFTTLDGTQRSLVGGELGFWTGWLNRTYTPIDETASVHADIRYSRTGLYSTAAGYYPGNATQSGDIWLGNTRFSGYWPSNGTYENTSVRHETGHAHGLKHSHEAPAMPNPQYDCRSHTMMSYHSYPGSPISSLTIAYGHHPQSLMSHDLEALHTIYGKSAFGSGPPGAWYSFNAATGQTNRNGAAWYIPAVPCIHLCLWEPRTDCIFDVSTSNEVVSINLNRLQWSTFFDAMVAELGGGNSAPGNVCMPYSDDPFSVVWAGSGGGTFAFNTNLTGNQIILPGNRATYTWTGLGRNWTGTHTPTAKVYTCTTMDLVSFADEENVPVGDLVEPPPPGSGRRIIWGA